MLMLSRPMEFEQKTPQPLWQFTHNLGRLVAADVFLKDPEDGLWKKVIPQEIIPSADNNTIQIVFPEPLAGKVTIC